MWPWAKYRSRGTWEKTCGGGIRVGSTSSFICPRVWVMNTRVKIKVRTYWENILGSYVENTAQYTVLTRESVISLNEAEWTRLASRNQTPSPDVVGQGGAGCWTQWPERNSELSDCQTTPLYVWWGSAATETPQKQKGTSKPRHETWARSNQITPSSLEVKRALLLAQALIGWWWSPADASHLCSACWKWIVLLEVVHDTYGSAAFKFQGTFLKTYFPPPFSRHFCPQLLCYRKYQNDLKQSHMPGQ